MPASIREIAPTELTTRDGIAIDFYVGDGCSTRGRLSHNSQQPLPPQIGRAPGRDSQFILVFVVRPGLLEHVRLSMAIGCLLGLLPAALGPGEASAADWLVWTGGDGCPAAGEFAAKVEANLGSPARETAERLRIGVWARIERVERDPSMVPLWLGEARLLDPAGAVVSRRTISKDGDSCADIVDALSLVTALLLSTAPEPTQPPPESPARLTAPVEPRPPATSHAWGAALDAGPSGGPGLLPGSGWAGELRAQLIPPRSGSDWRPLFVRFDWWAEGQATVPSGQGSRLRLWTAGAGLCPLGRAWHARSLAMCAGIDAGRLQAAGFGFDNASTHDLAFVDATAEGEAQQTVVGPIFLVLSLRATVPLLGTRVTYRTPAGEGQIHRTWPVTAVGHLGLGYRLP